MLAYPSVDAEMVHLGRNYSVAAASSIAGGGNTVFVAVVGETPIHFHDFGLDTDSGPALIELIESPTVSVLGTPVIPVNRNRICGDKSAVTVYSGSTITGGEVIHSVRGFAGGTGSNYNPSNGVLRGEFLLKPGLTYAVRITNEVTPAATMNYSADMRYYEAPV